MTANKNLKDELLKLGQANGTIGPTTGAKTIQQLIARDQARVARMRKLTTAAWSLVLLSLFAAAITSAFFPHDPLARHLPWGPLFMMASQGLLLIAAVFTVSLYVRSRTLTMHQIQASLSNIETLLRETLKDK
jgi:hypothetical protein